MNDWPLNPGLTDMISRRSSSSTTSRIVVDRRRRVHRDACLGAELPDARERAVQVRQRPRRGR